MRKALPAALLISIPSAANAGPVTDPDLLAKLNSPDPREEFPVVRDRFDAQHPQGVALGKGPHTLVVASQSGVTRLDYPSGLTCARARATALSQIGSGLVQIFCVPR